MTFFSLFSLQQIGGPGIMFLPSPPRASLVSPGLPKCQGYAIRAIAGPGSFIFTGRNAGPGPVRPKLESIMEKPTSPKPGAPPKKAPPQAQAAETEEDSTQPDAGKAFMQTTEEFTMPSSDEDAADFLLDEEQAKASPPKTSRPTPLHPTPAH